MFLNSWDFFLIVFCDDSNFFFSNENHFFTVNYLVDNVFENVGIVIKLFVSRILSSPWKLFSNVCWMQRYIFIDFPEYLRLLIIGVILYIITWYVTEGTGCQINFSIL